MEVSDLGWEIYPKGIYCVLRDLKRYKKPIYITENGLADADDKKRVKFITDHLFWIHKAIKQGIDVRGYFYWSLMDNFEWAWGFKPRFGLIEIDYKTLKRKPRPSSKVYAKICGG
jgi:beta-glucosidase